MGGWVVCGSSLGGTNTRLYAKSHLAYGLNEMRKRIDAMVTAQASTPPRPPPPCPQPVSCLLTKPLLPAAPHGELPELLLARPVMGVGVPGRGVGDGWASRWRHMRRPAQR